MLQNIACLRYSEERSSGSLRREFFGEKNPARLCQISVEIHSLV
ncbi:MAG: hypothetical protein P1P64_10010 [Treponemataceae bacterium]